jgi:bifunctional non-homologous end joining protein LigD
LPLSERRERLAAFLSDAGDDPRIRFVEHFDGDAVLKSTRQLWLEGMVSKRADAPYRSAAVLDSASH